MRFNLAGLLFLAQMVWLYTDITMIPYCPNGNGQSRIVIRKTPISVRYSLVEGKEQTWIGYPELNDRFTLNIPQRVRIWYKINIWTNALGSFLTRVSINGVPHQELSVLSMVHNERTMHAWDDLWLDKGTYFVNVEYINKITIRDMPPNSQGNHLFGLLKIEYLDFDIV